MHIILIWYIWSCTIQNSKWLITCYRTLGTSVTRIEPHIFFEKVCWYLLILLKLKLVYQYHCCKMREEPVLGLRHCKGFLEVDSNAMVEIAPFQIFVNVAVSSQSSHDSDSKLVNVLLLSCFIFVIFNSTFQSIIMQLFEALLDNLAVLVILNWNQLVFEVYIPIIESSPGLEVIAHEVLFLSNWKQISDKMLFLKFFACFFEPYTHVFVYVASSTESNG